MLAGGESRSRFITCPPLDPFVLLLEMPGIGLSPAAHAQPRWQPLTLWKAPLSCTHSTARLRDPGIEGLLSVYEIGSKAASKNVKCKRWDGLISWQREQPEAGSTVGSPGNATRLAPLRGAAAQPRPSSYQTNGERH